MTKKNGDNTLKIQEFLHPTSMLTPGIAGAITMLITNALSLQFGLTASWTGLVISFLCGTLVFVSNVGWIQKLVYYVLNSLIIFSVASGTAGFGASAARVSSSYFGMSTAHAATSHSLWQGAARLHLVKIDEAVAQRRKHPNRIEWPAEVRAEQSLYTELAQLDTGQGELQLGVYKEQMEAIRRESETAKERASALEMKLETTSQKLEAAHKELEAANKELEAAKERALDLEAALESAYYTQEYTPTEEAEGSAGEEGSKNIEASRRAGKGFFQYWF